MPRYGRVDRLNEELRHVIDAVIREEVRDPRVGGLYSITGVEVTRDLSQAKVRVSGMDAPDGIEGMVAALEHAASFIRREVKRRMSLRSVPELIFLPDEGIAYSVEIVHRIDQVMADQADRETDRSCDGS